MTVNMTDVEIDCVIEDASPTIQNIQLEDKNSRYSKLMFQFAAGGGVMYHRNI